MLKDKIIINTNDRDVYDLKELIIETTATGVDRGFANLGAAYKLDVTLINQRLDTLEKSSKRKFYYQLLTSAILLGIILFKAKDPLEALFEIIKILLTGVV